MPQSSKEKEAKYRANLTEARELKKANRPLEQRHESALAKYNRKLDNRKTGRQAKAESEIQAVTKVIQKTSKPVSKPEPKPSNEVNISWREKPRTLQNYPKAINEDTTHHDALGEVHLRLSDSLTEVPSHMTKNIDNMVSSGYTALRASRDAHNKGDVASAKENMQKAANHFTVATSEMGNRGVLGDSANKIRGFIKAQSHSYVSSSVPGTGSAPHENFVAPKKERVKKVSPTNFPSTSTSESLAKSYDSLPSDHDFPSSLGQQFKEQGGYKTGKAHMDSAVIGMMEGRY
jgi:hypothetical protein